MNFYKELHTLFNGCNRFHFPFNHQIHQMPDNGIYILFEKGEAYEEFDCIVRVGTHTGSNQLKSRLNQHFVKENKNRSIFRKNIGRCFLNKDSHPYIDLWELDITSKIEKEKNLKLLDLDFEKEMEKRITSYIRDNFSFCVFQVILREDRFFWESKILSTIAKFSGEGPSESWLGNHSPKNKIRQSGLWQVNELFNEPLESHELEKLIKLIF